MFYRRDPVCGARVKKGTKYSVKCGRRTYCFDSAACQTTFRENPEGFVGKKGGRSLLAWLGSGNEDLPKCCHDQHH